MESPPKRITRSRAAAKATEPKVKTTKIVTAAAKAKSSTAATASTRTTAGKRKTRSDESEGEDEEQQNTIAKKTTRGRPKKAADTEAVQKTVAPAPARATRARATRKATTTESKQDEVAPVRATRGRPKKADQEQEQPTASAAPKITRGRVGTGAKAAATDSKSTVKKTVTFQEPDKENYGPAAKTKEPAAVGLRGRPARRGGAAAARTTRANTKTTDDATKKPLSPKKVTQMPVLRDADSSEDELAATEKTPATNLSKSPIKPPSKAPAVAEPLHPRPTETAEDTDSTNTADAIALNAPEIGTAVLGSPARRPPSSFDKESMKSPARKMGPMPLPGSTMKLAKDSAGQQGQTSPFKTSLLQSAAKRPQSPIKGLTFGSVTKSQHGQSAIKMSMFQSPAKRAMPGFRPLIEPRNHDIAENDGAHSKLSVMATPTPAVVRPSEKLMLGEMDADSDDVFNGPMESLQFPGRLSAVLPRHADPALRDDPAVEDADDEMELLSDELKDPVEQEAPAPEGAVVIEESSEEPLEVEPVQLAVEEGLAFEDGVSGLDDSDEVPGSMATTPSQSPAAPQDPLLQLRDRDLDPYHDMNSDSEDERTGPIAMLDQTPTIVRSKPNRSSDIGTLQRSSRRSTMGFTLLAEQLDSWSAGSPIKITDAIAPPAETAATSIGASENSVLVSQPNDSPMSNHFFEDEMVNHLEPASEGSPVTQGEEEVEEPSMNDIVVTDEDVALAQEANEMSLMEPDEVDEVVGHRQSFDDSLSDASQEYGDENQMPIDPAIMGSANQVPTTPIRPMMASFHTTTKVPLKPADHSTPSPLKKRSYSAPRAASKRPSGLTRSATVISYSPTKDNNAGSNATRPGASRADSVASAPSTPAKSDIWSTIGTPARTPRKDVDTALLRGAVVFVDVHTSEGSDASSIFVELLQQMGARCIKTWNWNPSGPGDGEPSSKIGITHVVYKDGGKRTMEKVRQSNGVVHCVGVGWVLDCERKNEWLDEAPYYIDTCLVPRGGARRRKSMEPKALANQNGLMSVSPIKSNGSARDVQSAPNTPLNRRDSTLWMHSPSDNGEEQDENDSEWGDSFLTPVPKTPAPETIARYVDDIPDTPSTYGDELESPTKTSLLMRTCPAKSMVYHDMGENVLRKEKDEGVLMRLMAARRKSLQFAPKIASPLSKTWQ